MQTQPYSLTGDVSGASNAAVDPTAFAHVFSDACRVQKPLHGMEMSASIDAVLFRDVLIADLQRWSVTTTGAQHHQRVITDWHGKSHADAVRFAIWLADGWFEYAREQHERSKAVGALAHEGPPKQTQEDMVEALKKAVQSHAVQSTGLYLQPGAGGLDP